MPRSNGFDLSAARADRLISGAGHFPGDCHHRGFSSHSRRAPKSRAGDRGRCTSSRSVRATHSSGDGCAAGSLSRFIGFFPVVSLTAGGSRPRPFQIEAC